MPHLPANIRNPEESRTLLLTQKARLMQEAGAPEYVRLSFAASTGNLENGMDRLVPGLGETQ